MAFLCLHEIANFIIHGRILILVIAGEMTATFRGNGVRILLSK